MERPTLDALAKRLEALDSYESIRKKVKECLAAQSNSDIISASTLKRKIGEIDNSAKNWGTSGAFSGEALNSLQECHSLIDSLDGR